MSEHSTSTTATVKPDRPPGSPLFWHPSGRWAKKIRGQFHYFGRGPHDDALAQYERQAADRLAPSLTPSPSTTYVPSS